MKLVQNIEVKGIQCNIEQIILWPGAKRAKLHFSVKRNCNAYTI